jgi:stage II sporulation protein D
MSWMKRQRTGASVILAAVVALCGVERSPLPAMTAGAAPEVRDTLRIGMWTLWHDREVLIAPTGPGQKITLRMCEKCAAVPFGGPVAVRASGDEVFLVPGGGSRRAKNAALSDGATLTAHGETVTVANPVSITAHGGTLNLVITLPVETYVERVVASESGNADSMESLKALAIVVRSFALHEAHGHAGYDLCDSTHCQLLHWSGRSERAGAAHAATLATAGETLWFKGQRALAYFSKDCGGHTASASEVWPRAQAVEYLPSLPDRLCTASGSSEWATEISRTDLTAALAAGGVAQPGWQSLTVARRGPSGRATTVRLDSLEVSAEDFRLAVGQRLRWNRIPSDWFEVSRQGDEFLFHGRGMGHGVGLCQKGAAKAALDGWSERQILQQYFPGAQAADEASGREWRQFAGEGFRLETLDDSDTAFMPALARARAEASARSGLNLGQPITVRAFASTAAFRNETLAPGWVAAFTEGSWIGTQPLRTLAARKLLDATMRHEFLHGLVESTAAPGTPLWLREGLVELWSEPASAPAEPLLKISAVDATLIRASSEADSETAHRAAQWYAARLVDRYGRAQVLAWLRSGIPGGVVAGFGQH